ncbi:hypothetical protein IMSHALPRED_004887 [Imshaugia aleurites]|uniref:Uncharacterized protein n=1 Tax=Imshaugia aleurites TaxID=172621 RepID=A0A8H3IM72_9LECA|nr:hypothetical protein IMSHALPRED_004887 [Imshaugia aleurites]
MRHDTILAVHQLYVHEVYAQAEREGWSNRSLERVIRRCHQQEDKEIQSFLAAVEEAETRNARLHRIRRGPRLGDSDEEEREGDSEDNVDDDASCGPRDCIEFDDESSDNDSEGAAH